MQQTGEFSLRSWTSSGCLQSIMNPGGLKIHILQVKIAKTLFSTGWGKSLGTVIQMGVAAPGCMPRPPNLVQFLVKVFDMCSENFKNIS